MHWKTGDVVAERYRLERKLGEGGMGAVWAATHLVTRKGVAIKTLKADYAKSASLVERFLREARAACAVRHPNVVQIHDVIALDSETPIMVMDLLEGESLGERLAREKKIPVRELARIMLPVLSAVAAAHAASIVHRDLKPDNLFLLAAPSGTVVLTDSNPEAATVKVLDFGVAKIAAVDEGTDPLTKTGAMIGTPYYMSPEQLFGERDVDTRSDIWSLGIIMYECLTGRRPTEADNLGQIIKIVTMTGIPPLTSVDPTIPAEISDLVARFLVRDRSQRTTLDQARAVLARHQQQPSGAAAEPAPWASSEQGATAIPKERPVGLVAAGVVAGAALLGGVYLAATRHPKPSAPAALVATSAAATTSAIAPEPSATPTTTAAPAPVASAPIANARPATAKRDAAPPPPSAPAPAPSKAGPLEEKPPF